LRISTSCTDGTSTVACTGWLGSSSALRCSSSSSFLRSTAGVSLGRWRGVAEEKGRRVARWGAAVYADTEELLVPANEEQWRDDLAAAVFTRAAE